MSVAACVMVPGSVMMCSLEADLPCLVRRFPTALLHGPAEGVAGGDAGQQHGPAEEDQGCHAGVEELRGVAAATGDGYRGTRRKPLGERGQGGLQDADLDDEDPRDAADDGADGVAG